MMNSLTSQQRKLAYLGGIVVLLIPIIWLGRPATAEKGSGGQLASLRQRHDLGESTLGDLEPSSAAMNLVLLGLRGVAVDLLWLDADRQKERKDWAKLRSTVDSIILLQPHFRKVWEFQAWNLAYNVSVAWDDVADRYYWVKEGAKFSVRGTRRNNRVADLYWDTGNIIGHKMGQADEWEYYRKFFKVDPDEEKFRGGPDPAISLFDDVQFDDNYLAARHWFLDANRVEEQYRGQKIRMMRMLFRHYPVRAQIDYATSLNREGLFGERAWQAWQEAFEDWVGTFGQERFDSPAGTIILEYDEKVVGDLSREDGIPLEQKIRQIARYQQLANYEYWRTRCESESKGETDAAHRDIYEGKAKFREGLTAATHYRAYPGACARRATAMLSDAEKKVLAVLCESDGQLVAEADLLKRAGIGSDDFRNALAADVERKDGPNVEGVSPAEMQLQTGMEQYERMLRRFPSLSIDFASIEEGMMAVRYWRAVRDLDKKPLPDRYPLMDIWNANQAELEELEVDFQRDLSAKNR